MEWAPTLTSPTRDVELGKIGMIAPPILAAPPASGPAQSMTAYEVIDSFIALDQDKDGHISHDEFIAGLKANWQIAEKFGLARNAVLDDVPQEKYDLVFGQIDNDSSKSIDVRPLQDLWSFSRDKPDIQYCGRRSLSSSSSTVTGK